MLHNYDIISLCEAIYLHIHSSYFYGDISERKQDIKAVEKILSNQQVLETRNENVH